MSPSGRIIVLKGSPIVKEGKANSANILPGHHVALVSVDGDVGLGAAPVAGTAPRKAFAVEADVIGNTAADGYADNDQVKYVVAEPGAELMARAATGMTVVIGDAVYSIAAGQVDDAAAGAGDSPVGFALEAVTGATADDLFSVEVA